MATQRASYDDLQVFAPDGSTLYRQTFDDSSALDDFAPHAGGAPVDEVGASARPAGSSGGLIDLTKAAAG